MTLNIKGLSSKLTLAAVIACAVCLVPLAVPVALVGGGAVLAGQWGLGGAAVLVALFLTFRKTRKTQGTAECCGRATTGTALRKE